MMIPSVLEKFWLRRHPARALSAKSPAPADLALGGIDLLIGVLFLAAFFRTGESKTGNSKAGN